MCVDNSKKIEQREIERERCLLCLPAKGYSSDLFSNHVHRNDIADSLFLIIILAAFSKHRKNYANKDLFLFYSSEYQKIMHTTIIANLYSFAKIYKKYIF